MSVREIFEIRYNTKVLDCCPSPAHIVPFPAQQHIHSIPAWSTKQLVETNPFLLNLIITETDNFTHIKAFVSCSGIMQCLHTNISHIRTADSLIKLRKDALRF